LHWGGAGTAQWGWLRVREKSNPAPYGEVKDQEKKTLFQGRTNITDASAKRGELEGETSVNPRNLEAVDPGWGIYARGHDNGRHREIGNKWGLKNE